MLKLFFFVIQLSKNNSSICSINGTAVCNIFSPFETFAKSPQNPPKLPPRHLEDFPWAPSSGKPPKPWLPNTSTASHYWSWIKWLIGSRSNSTWIVKEPVTLETTAAVQPIPCCPCSKPSCSDNGTASPIPNSNTASLPASTSTCFAVLTSWASPITAPYAVTATDGARRHPVRIAGTD